ncbi:MAG TPA: hypothetical protein VL326_28575 [Kofleriaceae bacterium]|nr:hypothetical protein [Kofleriaceae bacterium]
MLALTSCGGDDGGGEPPVFPASYATTYQEVRNCRFSIDHNLRRIRVLASPDALAPYTDRMTAFPVGAVLLKVEHAEDDTSCSGPPIGFTAMLRLEAGADPALLDWKWQELDGDQHALQPMPARCASCHKTCGVPPEGYSGTCTQP